MVLRDSHQGKFYGCVKYPECKATHGAYDETGEPLGVPGDLETRQARMRAHDAFDPLWEDALSLYERTPGGRGPAFLLRVTRARAYAWLAESLSMTRDECHIGRFDVFHCDLTVRVCEGKTPADVRAWARQRSYGKKVAKLRKKWGAEQRELELERDDDD